jgi:hypothetical protein
LCDLLINIKNLTPTIFTFLGNKTLCKKQKWSSKTIFGGFGVAHSQRLFPLKHLWKYMDAYVGFEA